MDVFETFDDTPAPGFELLRFDDILECLLVEGRYSSSSDGSEVVEFSWSSSDDGFTRFADVRACDVVVVCWQVANSSSLS